MECPRPAAGVISSCRCGHGGETPPIGHLPAADCDVPGVEQEMVPEVADRIRHLLARTRWMRAEHERLAVEPAPASSLAAADLQDRSLRHVYDIPQFALSAALDHLETIGLLFAGQMLPAFSLMTLTRSAFETALAARWILEPEERDERRARGFAGQWANLVERGKFLGSLHSPAEPQDFVNTFEGVLAEARPYGLTHERNGRELLRLSMPNTIELVQRFPPDRGSEWLYRYQSGYSHARVWAMTLTLVLADAEDLGNDMFVAPASVPDEHLENSVLYAVEATTQAIAHLSNLHQG